MKLDGWQVILTGDNLSFLADGLLVTLQLATVVIILGIGAGTVLAILRQISGPWVRTIVDTYVVLIGNFPVLVVLLFVRFGLPRLGVPIHSGMVAAVVAFTAYSIAMTIEILRGAISSVDRGQREAAYASGFGPSGAHFRVVLPQALRLSLPGLAGQAIILVQGTTLVAVVGVADLLRNGTVIYARHLNPLEVLLSVGFVLYVLCSLLARLRAGLEARYKYLES